MSLGADGKHALAVDDRARARAVVVSVAVLEVGGVSKVPLPRASFGVQAFDDLFIADAVHEQEAVAGDGRRGVAGPLGELPHQRRRQRPAQSCLCRRGVVSRAEKRGPIVRNRVFRQRLGLGMHARLRRARVALIVCANKA